MWNDVMTKIINILLNSIDIESEWAAGEGIECVC